MIFVTVGTRNYPFTRLFKELDKLVDEGVIKEEIIAQIGTTEYIPRNYKFQKFVEQHEFQTLINQADIVISHGASGSIMKALNAKKKVIAVTRLEKYGEHINDHQIQINKAFGDNNYVLPVFEITKLGEIYQKLNKGNVELALWENNNKLAVVNVIDNFIVNEWKKMN